MQRTPWALGGLVLIAVGAARAQGPGAEGPRRPARPSPQVSASRQPAPTLAAVSSPEFPQRLVRAWSSSSSPDADWSTDTESSSDWAPAVPEESVGWPYGVVDRHGGRHTTFEPERHEWLQHLIVPFGASKPMGSAERVVFRRVFDFSEAYADCSTYIAADNPYELFVNGKRVGAGRQDAQLAREHAIAPLLRPGKNVLGLSLETQPQKAAVLTWTDLHQAFPVRVDRPMTWRSSLEAAPGWEKPGFNDRRWARAVPAPFSSHFQADRTLHTDPIWHPDGQGASAAYFRYTLRIDGFPNTGAVDIVADNAWELWVNGQLVGVEKRLLTPAVVRTIEVGSLLQPGENLIAVKAYNYGGPAALACLPRIKTTF